MRLRLVSHFRLGYDYHLYCLPCSGRCSSCSFGLVFRMNYTRLTSSLASQTQRSAKSKCTFASATARPYFSAMSVSDSGPSDRPTLFCDTILRFRPYFAFPSDRPTLFCDPILRFRPYFAFPTRAGPTDRPLAKAEDRSDLPTDRPSPGLPADANIHLDFAPPYLTLTS